MPSAADRSINPITQAAPSYTDKKLAEQTRFRLGSLASYSGPKKVLRGTVKLVSYEARGGVVIEADGVTAVVSPFALTPLGTAPARATPTPTSRRSTGSSAPKAMAPATIYRNGVPVESKPPTPAPVADLIPVPVPVAVEPVHVEKRTVYTKLQLGKEVDPDPELPVYVAPNPAAVLLASPRIPLPAVPTLIGRYAPWLSQWRHDVPRAARRALVRSTDVLPALDALAHEPAAVKAAVYPALLYVIAARDAAAPYTDTDQVALLDAAARTFGLPRAAVTADVRMMCILVIWPKWKWAVFTKKHGAAGVAP